MLLGGMDHMQNEKIVDFSQKNVMRMSKKGSAVRWFQAAKQGGFIDSPAQLSSGTSHHKPIVF